VDVINCAKFYRNRPGFEFYEWSKFDHSHRIAMSPLTLCELLFTLWTAIQSRWKLFYRSVYWTL